MTTTTPTDDELIQHRLSFTTEEVTFHGWTLERGSCVAVEPLLFYPSVVPVFHVRAVAVAKNRQVMLPLTALPNDAYLPRS